MREEEQKKIDLLSRLVTPTGTKGCARHVALAAPFVPVGVTNRDKRVLFVPVARPGTKGHSFCPGLAFPVGKSGQQRFPNRKRQARTKGGSFCPGSGHRDKRCYQHHVAGAPFSPRWCYQLGQKVFFFFMFSFSQFFFYFNYTFAFQLNLCIGIQCV